MGLRWVSARSPKFILFSDLFKKNILQEMFSGYNKEKDPAAEKNETEEEEASENFERHGRYFIV